MGLYGVDASARGPLITRDKNGMGAWVLV